MTIPAGLEMSDFASNLKRLRLRAGLSRRKLAEKVGGEQTMIYRYENGLRLVSTVQILVGLADALDVGLDELVGRTPPAPSRAAAAVRHRLLKMGVC